MRGFRRPRPPLPEGLFKHCDKLAMYKDGLFVRHGDHKNKHYSVEVNGHVAVTGLKDLLTCVYWYDKYMPIPH